MSFDRKTIKPTDTVELLGITLDKIINYKWHIQNVYSQENNKTKTIFLYKKSSKVWISVSIRRGIYFIKF